MKRIKILFSTLLSMLCAILCFALVGCAKDGSFVENSLEYKFTVYDGIEEIAVNFSFEVTTPSNTNYEVEYTINVYDSGKSVQKFKKSKTISYTSDGTYKISDYSYDDITYFSGATAENFSLKITNVSVKPKKQSDKYQNYAIGFGVVGGAGLIACTVLFIVFKLKEKK